MKSRLLYAALLTLALVPGTALEADHGILDPPVAVARSSHRPTSSRVSAWIQARPACPPRSRSGRTTVAWPSDRSHCTPLERCLPCKMLTTP